MSDKLQDVIAVVVTTICWHAFFCSKRQHNVGNAAYIYMCI